MATVVSICNSALIKCGVDTTISSLLDDSKEARLCNALYETVRDELLEEAYWNFATKRATLAQIATNPAFNYSYQYQLPSDCVRVKSLDDASMAFKIEEGKLLTNDSTAKLVYISNAVPVARYSAKFREALAWRLAANIAFSFNQSSSQRDSLIGIAEQWLSKAKTDDAQNDFMDRFQQDIWLDSRYGVRDIPDVEV